MDEIMKKAVGYDNFLINKEYSTITDHVARASTVNKQPIYESSSLGYS